MADVTLQYNLTPSQQAIEQLRKIGSSNPLGRISSSFSQFDKSLDASNARVLAFGASAGLILGVQRAFSLLVRETIGVEKAFQDINVILGLSNKNLVKFGQDLFDVAKNTGQSFKTVAEAAQELSRQGLSAGETLKRTRDALILTRQSGLDAEDSVKAITAALNSFQREALSSTQVINKLANVDANFAVSSKDLANAITRTGSAAEAAGVNFDQLIGLVTAAQQTTQRGGAVIAQALNSVFARIARPEVIEQLKELGVQIDNSQNGIDKLKALAAALQSAGQEQGAMIRETAGGVRNLNVLSAVLSDLQNQYSLVSRATNESTNATNQAIIRNEELNKTYQTLTNRTLVNLQQVGAQFGKLTIGPGLEKILGNINNILEGAISKNSDNAGEILGKGLLKGLGEFLGGPGLILAGAAIVKLISRLTVESAAAFKTVLGINRVQNDISGILQTQPALINQAVASEKGLLEVSRIVNSVLKERAIIQANLAKATPLVANRISNQPRAAVGLIPAAQEMAGAYAGGYTPGEVRETNIPNYGKVIYNSAERIRHFPGLSQPAIIPPQNSKAGIIYNQSFIQQHGFSPYKNEGLIPNFAISGRGISDATILGRLRTGAQKGAYFSDFYDKYEEHNPLQGKNKDLFNKIYAGLSYGADDRLVFNNSIDIFKGLQSGRSDFSPELSQLGLQDNRQVILNKILAGAPLTSRKTGVYYKALSGDRNALAIDRNFINTSLNRTLMPGEKISTSFRERLEGLIIGQLSPEMGLDPRAIQASVFAGRSKFRPSFYPFMRGFDRLRFGGLVPNYANIFESIGNVSKIAPGFFQALGGTKGLFGIIKGTTNIPELLGKVSGFAASPSTFIKTRTDLDSITTVLNTLGKSNTVRENVAKLFARTVNTSGFVSDSVAYDLGMGKNNKGGSLAEYLKYRLFGGQAEPEIYSAEMDNRSPLRRNKNGTYSILESYNLRDIGEAIGGIFTGDKNSARYDYGTKILSGNKALAYEYNLGRFIAKINKSRTKGIYEDRWDVNLHSDEQKALKTYFETGDKELARGLDNRTTYGGQSVNSLILRELLSNYRYSNPVTLKGVVDIPEKYHLRSPIFNGLIPNFSPISDAIVREANAGIPISNIRIGSSPLIRSNFNPAGLGVYNTQDEPAGLHQGITRAIKEGRNPKTYGVPNFAGYYQYTKQTIPQNDPYYSQREGPPINRLSLERELELQKVINSLKQEAKITALNLDQFNEKVKKAITPFDLITNSANQISKNLQQSYILSAKLNKNKPIKDFFPSVGNNELFGFGGGNQLPLAPSAINSELERALRQQQEARLIAQAHIKNLIQQNKLNPASVFTSTSGVYSGPVVREIEQSIREKLHLTNPTPTPPYVPNKIIPEQYGPSTGQALEQFRYLQFVQSFKNQEEVRKLKQESYKQNLRSSIFSPIQYGVRRGTNEVVPISDIIGNNVGVENIPQSQALQLALQRNRERNRRNQSQPIVNQSQGLYSRINGFINNPKFQNAAFTSSFILPVAAGALSEAIGNTSPQRRGVGQLAQSSANIASYTALGATLGFGVPGAIGGAVIGGILETPRVIKSFTDTIPDLERELDNLKTKISEVNNGFSNIIVTNEKINQYRRGELRLSPEEYGNLKVNQNQQIESLATLFPKYATSIRNVSESGSINDIERVSRLISFENEREARSKNIEILTSKFRGGIFSKSPTEDDIKRLAQFAATQPPKNIENTKSLYNYLLEDYKKDKTGSLIGQFSTILPNIQTDINKLGKQVIPTGLGSDLVPYYTASESEQIIQKNLAEKDITVQADKWIEFLTKFGAISERDFSPFINTIREIKDPKLRSKIIAEQAKTFNFQSVIEGANIPKINEQKIQEDTSGLIKAFFDLRKNIELFSNRLEIIASSDLAKIQRELNLKVSGIQTSTAISSGKLQAFSPFGAAELEIGGAATEQRANIEAQINILKRNQVLNNQSLPTNIFAGFSELALKESQQNKNTSPGTFLKGYKEKLGGVLEQIIPGYKSQETIFTGTSFESKQNDPFIAINDYLTNARPEKVNEFVKKLTEYREGLFKLSFNETGKTRDELEKTIELIDTATIKYQTSTDTNEQKLQELQQNLKDITELSNNNLKKAKQALLNNIIQQNANIIDNIEQYNQSLLNIYENNKGTGFQNVRNVAFGVSTLNLNTARERFKNGDISSRQFAPYVSENARQEIETTGGISRGTLKDVFKSGFGYNQRDFSQDLLQDMENLRDVFSSIRGTAKDAFASIVDGSKSAGDAARQFGITIATNVLNNVAKLAFDNLLGNIFSSSNLQSIGSLFTKKAVGGLVGYADGGIVYGGSGIRDDVPAMLNSGAFVIKKSSVNKYGKSMLDSLNYGQGFANGGINQILKNTFKVTGKGEKIKGAFDVDPRLSVIGQTDENNPSNILKFDREQNYIGYLKTIENYKIAMKNFESAQTQRLYGAYLSGIINIGGSYLGQYKSNSLNKQAIQNGYDFNGFQNNYSNVAARGGLLTPQGFRKFAYGGSVDTVPALLTGGEYVMSREAVNRMGVSFMNNLNNGQVQPRRYAVGGLVGKDSSNTSLPSDNNYNQQIVNTLLRIAKINEEIRDVGSNKKVETDKNAPNKETNYNTPQISIVINMNNDKTSTQTQSKNDQSSDSKNIKDFAELMKNVALNTILEQQRNGGLLSKK